MRQSRVLLALGVIALLVMTLGAKPADVRCNVKYDDVVQRQYSGIMQEEYRVFDNEEDFCAYWVQIHSIMFPQPPCPAIDFERGEVVISAAIGSRPNGCYNVSISCIEKARRKGSKDLTVTVTETIPGPTCACTQAIVNPVHVVKVKGPIGNVDFVKQFGILNCP